ncbi:MAG: hypothetical protein FD149_1107 [Rhodospirillaceae bacterium]|nr:MAG: hypothetical protein FD149_1107 [Rhodospirillaceae bacterium]
MNEEPANTSLPLNEHPDRRRLAGEVHARPFEILPTPCRITHIALLADQATDRDAEWACLCALYGAFALAPPEEESGFLSVSCRAFRLRWERHTEFSSYTFFRFDSFADPFAETALARVPADWLKRLPGRMLVGLHVALEAGERPPEDLPAGHPLVGAQVSGGAGLAWTDYHLHADGFGRALVRNVSLTGGQAGRLVQRLVEIETYRMMALLGFPVARALMPEMTRLENGVVAVVAALAEDPSPQTARDQLSRLTVLAAEAAHRAGAAGYRFAASAAYHDIVCERITALRESRLPGLQTFAEFMDRRLTPAMATCRAAAERLEIVNRRLTRAGDLLRTRVDIALEENNRDLLASMDRRARLQLRLQETVEGLSVVAISYYALGLISYLAKGLKAAAVPVDSDLAVMGAVPVIVGLVWMGVRRLRKAPQTPRDIGPPGS